MIKKLLERFELVKSNPTYKVLYQPYTSMNAGPFKYIEGGYIKGLRKAGCEVVVWDGLNNSKLCNILREFRPDIFVGYLRTTGDYKNFSWTVGESFNLLNSYRKSNRMKVALHTHPDVQKLTTNLKLEFVENDPSSAGYFYTQPPPPTQQEENLVAEGFIDIIIHPYSKEVTKTCFVYWTDQGIKVLEEPLAADDDLYTQSPMIPRIKSYDITYVGGWWPFKGQQLDKYLLSMKNHFGQRLKVYGRGWSHISEGYVSDRKYKKIVQKSKINLVFHEPSQVKGIPIHVNERIFKIYAMGAFAICDNNSCLKEYFAEDELVIASDPEDMIDKCNYYLDNESERKQIAEKGYKAVKNRHTYVKRAERLISVLVDPRYGL